MLTNIWPAHKDINGASRGANTRVYTPQLTPQAPWVDILAVGTGLWHLVLALALASLSYLALAFWHWLNH